MYTPLPIGQDGPKVLEGVMMASSFFLPIAPPQAMALPVAAAQVWLQAVQRQVEAALVGLLELPDEASFNGRWTRAMERTRVYALRPAKRVRPALVVAGYSLARGSLTVPSGLWRFAAGLELLHTFLLIHDDVADQA